MEEKVVKGSCVGRRGGQIPTVDLPWLTLKMAEGRHELRRAGSPPLGASRKTRSDRVKQLCFLSKGNGCSSRVPRKERRPADPLPHFRQGDPYLPSGWVVDL